MGAACCVIYTTTDDISYFYLDTDKTATTETLILSFVQCTLFISAGISVFTCLLNAYPFSRPLGGLFSDGRVLLWICTYPSPSPSPSHTPPLTLIPIYSMLVWGKSDQCYVRLRALFKLYGMLFEGRRPAEWDTRLLDKATLLRDQTAYEARLVASLLLFFDCLRIYL